jgi:ParB/RepB/Spo0J family partition protein
MNNKIVEIGIDVIDDPHTPMRSGMDEEKLVELMRSIERHGLMQPLTLRKVGKRYEVIAGHRRLTALKRMGRSMVPAVVTEADDARADELRMAENLYREDINPVDEARYIHKMVEEHHVEPQQLAEMTGKTVEYLMNRYDLLTYAASIISALEAEQIPLGAAQWLQRISDERVRDEYVRFAITGGITVIRARAWYESWKATGAITHEGVIAIPDRTATGEPIAIYDACAICRNREDINKMRMHYAHDECVQRISEAIQQHEHDERLV